MQDSENLGAEMEPKSLNGYEGLLAKVIKRIRLASSCYIGGRHVTDQ